MRTQLSFHIENIFDTEYAVVQHYPMPPRHCRLRLLIEFNDNESDQIN